MDGGQARSPDRRPDPRAAAKPPQGFSAAALEKRLGLRKRAREDAARNVPRPETEELSQAEQAIIAAVATERAKVDALREEARAETERRLRALAPSPQDFSAPALDAQLALKQVAGRVAPQWSEGARLAAQARGDLDAFKRAHGLRRAAVYPRSTMLQAGLLLCAAVFEALFSAALFAEDDERGLLGGAITAIGLSGANVTLGFLAGFLGLRYLQHSNAAMRTGGAIAFGAMTLLALMLNLFAADWRDRLAAIAGRQLDPGSEAGFQIWSLLQLSSPQAVILLMLGAGVWVFAALKGYSGFDDPYPDYGKMARSARDAAEAFAEIREEARAELESPIETARAAIAGRLERMRAEYAAMNRAFDAAAQRMEALDVQARALDEAAAAAVYLYRQENMAARTAPAPAYFSTAPPAAGPALDALAASAALVQDARERVDAAQAQSAEALQGLLAELEETSRRLDGSAAS